MNRAQTKLDVWRFDRSGGSAALVLSDSDPALVYQKEIQFADGGRTWIVSFEKDGQTHLYRYGADGIRKNAITQGAWSVRGGGGYDAPQNSAFIDDAKRRHLFLVDREIAPRVPSLSRSGPTARGKVRITKEDGTHKVTFSPDRRYFVDAYSNRNTLPSLALYAASGERLSTLWETGQAVLAPYGLTARELLTIPAPDGFPHPGEPSEAGGFQPREEVSRPHPRLRRARLSDRRGPLGPRRSLRAPSRPAGLRRGVLRSAQRRGSEQGAGGPRRREDDERRRARRPPGRREVAQGASTGRTRRGSASGAGAAAAPTRFWR